MAGGKSSRFGRDKCLHYYKGIPLFMNSLEILKKALTTGDNESSLSIIVSTNNLSAFREYNIRPVSDIYKNTGPLAGLHSALTAAATEAIAVIPCDTPFIHPDLYNFLLKNSGGFDAVIPTHGKYSEPLCGIYRKSCLIQFEKAIREGQLKILDALNPLKVNFADTRGEWFYSPDMFHNINRISDIPS